jgi:oligosaccharide repeat unit polymerase
MKDHPAMSMIKVWIFCILLYTILPFQLESRVMTVVGFGMLFLFIATFCGGALLASPPLRQDVSTVETKIDFRLTDFILKSAAVVALLAFTIDVLNSGIVDLAASYQDRSDRANDLLLGAQSSSSLAFQIGFLFYPACYVLLLREIGFKLKPSISLASSLGLLPVLLATLSLGGRAPLFYALLMIAFGFSIRKQVFGVDVGTGINLPGGRIGAGFKVLAAVSVVAATVYFIQVFFVRAESVGGAQGMFDIARESWGVNFNGYLSGFMFAVFGDEITYLIFIFAWYLVQGLVMSNVLFTEYGTPAQLGIYGVDLVAAVMRRVNGDLVAEGFSTLLNLNTYGFLPSAFGSLYVDFLVLGLLFAALWGWLAGVVYRNIKRGRDPRWLLLGPFVSLGIFFSLINTPIGFSNGLMTHFWMLVAFFTATTLVRVPLRGRSSTAAVRA